ncbi:MAG: toprim domain-containing protein [Methylovulum sp.]
MKNDLRELLDAIDMETWLDSQGIKYKHTRGSSGEQLNLKTCPVCGGDVWKVYLNADSGLGNCFSGLCEARFNKYSFIKANLPGVSTADVMRHIRAMAAEQGWRQKKQVKFTVDMGELKFPESVELPLDGKNLKYLTDRNISSDIASYFYLRYSKHGSFTYHDGKGERSQSYASRVIIPIYDLDGTLVSFQGRDTTGTAERKYLFPPGYSSTGKYLFNGHNALRARRVVICEGVFDVMAAKIALDASVPLRDVVPIGSFGKHLSNGFGNDQVEQIIKLKKRGLREVTFMWDGEVSAIKAAIKSALVLSGIGLKARVAILPENKDPNDCAVYEVIDAFNAAHVITKLSAIKLLSNLNRL